MRKIGEKFRNLPNLYKNLFQIKSAGGDRALFGDENRAWAISIKKAGSC
jgi:hypothetical protein